MKTFGSSEKFIQGKSLEWENVAEGVKRKIMGYDDKIMLVHVYFEKGIDENMSIDNTKHSLFGASKVAADILVQEYGKYFGLKTVSN